MLKIVVFDIGWGGEFVADYLAAELGTVEIIRATSWQSQLYDIQDETLLYNEVRASLHEYIGKVDLIVLGGYVVSLALDFLQKTYPQQKFIGMSINYYRVLQSRYNINRVVLLMNDLLVRRPIFEEIRQGLPESTVIVPDCSGWEELVDVDEMSVDVLRYELKNYFALTSPNIPKTDHCLSKAKPIPISSPLREQVINFLANSCRTDVRRSYALTGGFSNMDNTTLPGQSICRQPTARIAQSSDDDTLIRPDVVLLLNTHFWGIKEELSEVFGISVNVMDFRNLLLHDVCRALELRGVHGERSKW